MVPKVPDSAEALGFLLGDRAAILKHLYFHNEMLGRELAGALGLQFSLIDGHLRTSRQHFIGVKKSLGMGNASGSSR